MKSKYLCWFIMLFLFVQCDKEDEFNFQRQNTKSGKLKRVIMVASIDSDEALSIIEEYEYDEENRISKVSSPMYDDGIIVGTIQYKQYEYNSSGELVKIAVFNANSNAPDGFINLRNFIYSYSKNGRLQEEKIEYPQIGSFEYSKYLYVNSKHVRIEKYSNKNELEGYVINEYDKSGNLISETSYANDDIPYLVTEHTYTDGLNVRSDVYLKDNYKHVRQIIKHYDNDKKLVALESHELSIYSSMHSFIFKYEYYDD